MAKSTKYCVFNAKISGNSFQIIDKLPAMLYNIDISMGIYIMPCEGPKCGCANGEFVVVVANKLQRTAALGARKQRREG